MRKIFICITCCFFITLSITATAVTYGPTTKSDNLWQIANKVRPNEEVSAQQVMLAIFCYNSHAFYANNINALEVGAMIKVPGLDEIEGVSKEQAYLEVEKQNAKWKKAKLRRQIKQKRTLKKSKDLHSRQTKQSLPITTIPQEEVVQAEIQVREIVQPEVLQQKEDETVVSQLVVPSAPELDPVFVTETNDRLVKVEDKNNAFHHQIAQLNRKIIGIEEELYQLKQQSLKNENIFLNKMIIVFGPIQQYADKLAAKTGQPLFDVLVICFVAFLFLILIYLIVRRRKSFVSSTNLLDRDVSLGEEYNPMEGEESVAAKLNLARSYIDMGKKDEAKDMLHEVLVNGDVSEQAQAKELLEKISNPAQ